MSLRLYSVTGERPPVFRYQGCCPAVGQLRHTGAPIRRSWLLFGPCCPGPGQVAPQRGRDVRRVVEPMSMSVETFTIREAAKRCKVTYQSMRKRVDRGTIQTVKKEGVRLVPRSELERAGLWPGSTTSDAELHKENERLRQELEQHRVLTEQAQSTAEAERTARTAAEAEMSKAKTERLAAEQLAEAKQKKADAFQADLEEISKAGPIKALRLRRQIRSRLEEAA